MELTEYNNYLLNLHKDCSLSCMTPTGNFDKKKATNTFDILAENFNNTLASQMLNQLNFSKRHKNIIEKLESYPYMFWQTKAGKDMIVNEKKILEDSYIVDLEDQIKKYNNVRDIDIKSREFYIVLNSGIAEGGEQYGEGVFKNFSKNTLKLHLMVGESIPTVENIINFSTKVVDIMEREQVKVESVYFTKYIKNIFKNTAIANEVSDIDFESIFNNKSTNARKLKV